MMDARQIARWIGALVGAAVILALVAATFAKPPRLPSGSLRPALEVRETDPAPTTAASADSDEYTSEGEKPPSSPARNPLAGFFPSGPVVEWRDGFPICPKCKQPVAFEATGCRGGHEFAWATHACDLCDGTGQAPCTRRVLDIALETGRQKAVGFTHRLDSCDGTGKEPRRCRNCDGGRIRARRLKGETVWHYGTVFYLDRPEGFAAVKPTKLIEERPNRWGEPEGRSRFYDCPVCPVDGSPEGMLWGSHYACNGTGKVKCPRCLGTGEVGRTSPYN